MTDFRKMAENMRPLLNEAKLESALADEVVEMFAEGSCVQILSSYA